MPANVLEPEKPLAFKTVLEAVMPSSRASDWARAREQLVFQIVFETALEAVSRLAVLTIELGPGTHRGVHEDCNIRMCKHSACHCWLPARGLLLKSSLSSVASRTARDAGKF